LAIGEKRIRSFLVGIQNMALKALYKDNKYPSHGVIEEFVKLSNFHGSTVKQILENPYEA